MEGPSPCPQGLIDVSEASVTRPLSASSVTLPMLPAWLQEDDRYEPLADHDRFLQKNALKLTSLLARVKAQRGGLENESRLSPLDRLLLSVDVSLRLGGIVVLILCTALARNMFFVYVMVGLVLVVLAFKHADALAETIKPALAATGFAVLITIPAIFLGQPASCIRISLKVFVTVSLLSHLSHGVAWNQLVGGLRFYRVPQLVVCVLDMALKYIVLLGEVASHVLDALRLRSVGRNPQKSTSTSNVLGVTFLKAHDYGEEMYEAMECRGFTGDYLTPPHRVITRAGLCYLGGVLLIVCLFVYFEVAL